MKYPRKLVDDYNTYDFAMFLLTGNPECYRRPLDEEGFDTLFWKHNGCVALAQRPQCKYTQLFAQYVHGDITVREIYNLIKDDYKLFPREFSVFSSEGAVEDFVEIEE